MFSAFDLRFAAHVDQHTVRYTEFAYKANVLAALQEPSEYYAGSHNDMTLYMEDLENWHEPEGYYAPYQVDYSTHNMWVRPGWVDEQTQKGDTAIIDTHYYTWIDGTQKPYQGATMAIHFGDPYRKEVDIDDMLGTYQSGWFQLVNGKIAAFDYHYQGAGFWQTVVPLNKDGSPTLPPYEQVFHDLRVGLDVQGIFRDHVAAYDAFYHETGMMY